MADMLRTHIRVLTVADPYSVRTGFIVLHLHVLGVTHIIIIYKSMADEGSIYSPFP